MAQNWARFSLQGTRCWKPWVVRAGSGWSTDSVAGNPDPHVITIRRDTFYELDLHIMIHFLQHKRQWPDIMGNGSVHPPSSGLRNQWNREKGKSSPWALQVSSASPPSMQRNLPRSTGSAISPRRPHGQLHFVGPKYPILVKTSWSALFSIATFHPGSPCCPPLCYFLCNTSSPLTIYFSPLFISFSQLECKLHKGRGLLVFAPHCIPSNSRLLT